MKKFIFLLSGLLFSAMIIHAQTKDTLSQRAKENRFLYGAHDSARKEALREQGYSKKNIDSLHLSNEQKKKLYDIHKNARDEKEQVKNDSSLSEAQKQEKLKKIDERYKGKMNDELTPEQRKQLKQDKENAQRKEKNKENPPPHP